MEFGKWEEKTAVSAVTLLHKQFNYKFASGHSVAHIKRLFAYGLALPSLEVLLLNHRLLR